MADISRDSFDASKNYRKVLFQKERHLLDFELNELQDILAHAQGRLLEQMTEGVALIGSAGFVSPSSADRAVNVTGGVALHEGEVIFIPDANNVVVFPSGSGTQSACVYVEWWDEEVTYADDPDIYDPTFDDTAARVKRNVVVAVNTGSTDLPSTAPNGGRMFKIASVTHNFSSGAKILGGDIEHELSVISPGELSGEGPERTLRLISAAPEGEDGFVFDSVSPLSGVHSRWLKRGEELMSLDAEGNFFYAGELLGGGGRMTSPLHIDVFEGANLAYDGALTVGELDKNSLAINGTSIVARNNGKAADLHLNGGSGKVYASGSPVLTESNRDEFAAAGHDHDSWYYRKGEVDDLFGSYHTKSEIASLLAKKLSKDADETMPHDFTVEGELIAGSVFRKNRVHLANQSGTVQLNLRDGNVFHVHMSGGVTIQLMNMGSVVGSTFDIIVEQDSIGGRSLAFSSSVKWEGGTMEDPSSTGGSASVYRVWVVSSNTAIAKLLTKDVQIAQQSAPTKGSILASDETCRHPYDDLIIHQIRLYWTVGQGATSASVQTRFAGETGWRDLHVGNPMSTNTYMYEVMGGHATYEFRLASTNAQGTTYSDPVQVTIEDVLNPDDVPYCPI